jgi:hypothetical protein
MKLNISRRMRTLVIIFGAPAIALFVFIGGEIVMQLWNWLLPPLFGWPQVTFWQGLGLLALCRILFGGLGGHGSGPSPSRTPEERERFWQAARARCGIGPSASESKGDDATSTAHEP